LGDDWNFVTRNTFKWKKGLETKTPMVSDV
jgi:hypothetical protein